MRTRTRLSSWPKAPGAQSVRKRSRAAAHRDLSWYLVSAHTPPLKCASQPGPQLSTVPVPAGTSDANGLPQASSTPGVGGSTSSTLGGAGSGVGVAGGPENGKPGADVVDLTLDSSSSEEDEEDEDEDDEDDDEGPRPKRRCPFQKGLVPAC